MQSVFEQLQKCEHCGASMRKWKHSLTRGLVRTFVKFVYAVRKKNFNEVHLQNDVELTKNEYNNFQKLHYFGLVAKAKKPGHWVLTKWGGEFFRNQRAIPKFAISFRDHLIERQGATVTIRDFYGKDNAVPFDEWQKQFESDPAPEYYLKEPATV